MQRLRIVVDANMLISLLMAEGSKRKLFFSEYLNPVAPEFVLFETGKYWNEVIEKCGLPDEIVKGVFSEVRRAVRTYSLADMKDFVDDATQAAPDKDDAE
jgi:predicted nucleic acid-binding protein